MDAVDQLVPPTQESSPGLVHDRLMAFLASSQKKEGRDYIRRFILRRLYPVAVPHDDKLDTALVDELTHLAVVRALEARQLPWTTWGIKPWLKRLIRRTIWAYFKKSDREEKYIARDVDPADVLTHQHQAFPPTDTEARNHLLAKYWGRKFKDDPKKAETLRLIYRNEHDGYSIPELAAETGVTDRALANRMFRLKQEMIPQYRVMDDEKKRRGILIAFWGFCVAAIGVLVVVLLWQWLRPTPAPAPPPAKDVPTMTAPTAEPFNQALPAPPSAVPVASAPADAGRPRPRPRPAPVAPPADDPGREK